MPRGFASRVLPLLALVAAAAAAVIQTADAGRQSVEAIVRKVWVNRHASAIERGADAAYGETFMQLVSYIRAQTPVEASIYLLGSNSGAQYLSPYYLEFYVFPRQVTRCPTEDNAACIQASAGLGAFLLDSEGLVPADLVPSGSSVVVIGERVQVIGRFVPQEEARPLPLLGLLALDGLVFAALAALGGVLAVSLAEGLDWPAIIGLSLGIGGGALSWALFLTSWAGAALDPTTSTGVFLSLLTAGLVALAALRHKPSRTRPPRPLQGRPRLVVVGLECLIALLVLAAGVLSWGLAYHSWDGAAIWGVKGYAIGLLRSIFAAGNWGTVSLAFPLNIPILIGLFFGLDGDALPGSKLLFPLFLVSMLIVARRFWRRQGVSPGIASLGTLLLASTPLIFTHATIAYTNLPLAFYVVAGALLLIEGAGDRHRGKMLLGGALLGFASWTRPEGVLLSAAVLIVFLLIEGSRRRGSSPLLALLPWLLVLSPWLVFLQTHYVDVDEYMASRIALGAVLHGDIRWEAAGCIVRFLAGQVVRYREYGLLLLVDLGLLAVGMASSLRQARHITLTLAGFVSALGVGVFGILYVFAYHPRGIEEVVARLGSDFSRVFLPVAVLLTIAAILALDLRLRPVETIPDSPAPAIEIRHAE